jgi:signal transduction histidine kinase
MSLFTPGVIALFSSLSRQNYLFPLISGRILTGGDMVTGQKDKKNGKTANGVSRSRKNSKSGKPRQTSSSPKRRSPSSEISAPSGAGNPAGRSEEEVTFEALAGHVAHEINNPLEYINNYLYLLSESLPSAFPKRDYLQKIENGIAHLAALARDLLEISRRSADDFKPQAIHGIIDRSIENFQHQFIQKNVKVSRSYRCTDCVVLCSEHMLNQVFNNVIQNALDAMTGGGGELSVITSCTNGMFTLQFADTGVGIAREHLGKVFHPFFTTKKSNEKRGTGLGLTLCYNFTKLHRGLIRLESRLGSGTTVTIALPLLAV